MSTIYLITGPAGVGKSTVSLEIAKSLNKSVLLEGDDFYHQVVSSYVQAWKEGVLKQYILLKDGYHDAYIYATLNENRKK